MKLNVTIDTRNLEAKTLREAKRLAYSMTKALNNTALAVQNAQRQNIHKKFTVRNAPFMDRLVKITFASVKGDRAYAEVYIDPTKKRVVLQLFQDGGLKEPAVGSNVAVPITGEAARPSFNQPVVTAFTFQQLHFKRSGVKRGTGTVLEGNENTFLIPGVGVFERISKSATELIYAFKKPMRMDKRLDFYEIAQKTFEATFEEEFKTAYELQR
jgi:hypothetical protein